MTFADSLNLARGNHFLKTGADVRMIRMATDQQGGITYSFANLDAFLGNTPTTIQYFGDLSEPSPFHNGASGMKHTKQEYYVAFAQDEWHVTPKVTLNYGLRYDYYTPLTEKNDLIVKFNIDTGKIDPSTTALYASKKNNFQPRVSMTYAPGKTVLRGGFGVFVGPGQTEDQIQPVESDRISSTLSSGAFPIDPALLVANFANNPNTRSYHCPGDKRSALRPPGNGWGYDSYSKANPMNGGTWQSPNQPVFTRFSELLAPTYSLTFLEESDPRGYNWGTWVMDVLPSPGWVDPFSIYHGNSSTFCFADGSAELHRWDDPAVIKAATDSANGISSFFWSGGSMSNPTYYYMYFRYRHQLWVP